MLHFVVVLLSLVNKGDVHSVCFGTKCLYGCVCVIVYGMGMFVCLCVRVSVLTSGSHAVL